MNVRDGIAHPEERFVKRALASRCRSELTHTAFVAEQTMEFLTRHRDGPFLCIAGFYSPHDPWVAPQEFLDRYDPAALTLPPFPPALDARRGPQHFSDDELRSARHGYYAMVSEVDHHVGRILDRLDALGIADNTIVVFTSDHGEWLGEHLRYVVDAGGAEALFDLERDPLAYQDVAGDSAYATQLQAVRKRLLERLLARERPLPRQWTY